MHTWYRAVCHSHGERIDLVVRTNGSTIRSTASYLEKNDQKITRWLEGHSGCALTLEHLDEDLDKLWEVGGYHDPISDRCLCASCKGKR